MTIKIKRLEQKYMKHVTVTYYKDGYTLPV